MKYFSDTYKIYKSTCNDNIVTFSIDNMETFFEINNMENLSKNQQVGVHFKIMLF
jgi:hypothetical protein